MATGLQRIKNRIRGARRKVAAKSRLKRKSRHRVRKFLRVIRQSPKGSPKRKRAKRKVGYWRGVKVWARRQRAMWHVILNRRIRKKIEYLREHPPAVTGRVVPVRPWNPYRKPVCGWMVEWLDKAWAHGWRGYIVSGVRTPQESTSACYHICGHPTCPGRCAGIYSNHNSTTCAYPEGAIDVTDFYNLAAIFRQIGAPLCNALPLDRVHFSHTGH